MHVYHLVGFLFASCGRMMLDCIPGALSSVCCNAICSEGGMFAVFAHLLCCAVNKLLVYLSDRKQQEVHRRLPNLCIHSAFQAVPM